MPKFFVAVLPPNFISKEIILFQKSIEQDFSSRHAQKVPPHITIIPPFECQKDVVEKLEEAFIKHLRAYPIKTSLQLDNFQRFESRTLFVDVAKNEAFEQFCKALKHLFNQQKIIKQREEKHFFVPHITLANKDIKKRDFDRLWLQFSNMIYQRNFQLTSIVVLELIEEKWQTKKSLSLSYACKPD